MKQLICLGDSLTDCDRMFTPDGLGYGYVRQLNDMLLKKTAWKTVNRGVNGFTLNRVLENLSTDCLKRDPDAVTLLVGINDISMWMCNTSVSVFYQLQKFRLNLLKLFRRLTQYTSASLYLLEPFVFPRPAEYYHWFEHLNAMSQVMQELCEEYRVTFIPLHRPLNDLAQQVGYSALTIDGIHLTPSGHRIIAAKLYKYFENPA